MSNKLAYTVLRDEILNFVKNHTDPAVAPFKQAMANWGSEWMDIAPNWLPAAARLDELMPACSPQSRSMLEAFLKHRDQLFWEQSYKKSDNLVGDDMLNGYGFAEVIGKRGPFISTTVRSGIGIWGPNIHYPAHRHEAEEIYIVLSGTADFALDGEPVRRASAGDCVHVSSFRTHGIDIRDESLAVFYIWKDGDLRQTSSFD